MGSLSVLEVVKELYISLTALVFNLMFWIVLERQGFRRTKATRAFCNMVMSVFFANLISCVTTIFQHSDIKVPPVLVSGLQMLVYLFNTLLTFAFSVYILHFFGRQEEKERRVPLFNKLMVAVQAVLLVAWFAYAAPGMIRTGEYITVPYALFYVVGYAMELYHILYAVWLIVRNHVKLRRRTRNTVILGVLLTILTIVVQAVLGPLPLVNYLGATLGMLLFYFGVESSAARAGDVAMRFGKETQTGFGDEQDHAAESPVYPGRVHGHAERRIRTDAPQSGRPKDRVRKRSIIGFLFAIISALILGSYILLGVLLYRRSEDMFMRELKDNALNNAKTIAAAVDAEAFSRLYPGCQGNEDFNNVLDTLCLFRDNAGLQYVYTTWYDENGIPVMCVDSDPVAPGDMGDALGYAEATHLALAGTPAVYDTPVTDDWGAHLSAFAPITYEGTVYGAVGVDLDYSWVAGQLRGIVILIVIICVICFAVTMIILLLLARYLKRKFRLLNSRIDVLSYDAEGLQKIAGLQNGDEFEMIAEHINEVFERNMAAQHAEAEKLRSAMSEVERRAEEKVSFYAARVSAISAQVPAGGGTVTQAQTHDVPSQTVAESAPVQTAAESVPVQTVAESQAAAQTAQTDADVWLPEMEDGITKEEAIRRVKAAAPEMIASYRELIQTLAPYFGPLHQEETDAALPEMDAEELRELYEAVAEFAEIYDADGIMGMLRQTEGYAIPEEERKKIARIRECVKNSDWSELQKTIHA